MAESITFEQYEELCERRSVENPSWRFGQTVFNVLHEMRPDLSERIRGDAVLDPFYADEATAIQTIDWIAENW